MFTQPTVFVLGAGASWHYGFPTGEKLVSDVIAEARTLSDHYARWGAYGQFLSSHAKSKFDANKGNDPQALSNRAKDDCHQLVMRLEALNPPVIDYFLGHNPSLQDIGRFTISLVILKAEASFIKGGKNRNRLYEQQNSPFHDERVRQIDLSKFKDDWIRFVIYHMSSGCAKFTDFLKNEVQFVTFNYDTCLERRIAAGIAAIELFQDGQLDEFFAPDRVVHVYGNVGNYTDPEIIPAASPQKNDISLGSTMESYLTMLNTVYERSKKIRTIDPDDKEENAADIECARSIIARANRVYVLGYGFDTSNNKRLNLHALKQAGDRPIQGVYFTNLRDSSRINRRASELFFRVPDLLPKGTFARGHCEKSDRDVYSALESDFELFS